MHLLDIVLPVFLVIALGYALRVRGFLPAVASTAMSRLVFYVAAPALLVQSIGSEPLGRAVTPAALGVMGGVTILMTLGVYAACRRCPPERRGVLAQGANRSNMVFVGLPVVANAFGEKALATVSVTIGFMIVLYNVLAVLVLTLPHRSASARDVRVWLGTIRQMLTNPLVLSCAAGVALSAGGVALPVIADRTLQLVGRTAMPIALLTVGAELDFRRLRGDLRAALGISFLKLILYPALILAGLRAIGLTAEQAAPPLLVLASPTAVVSYVMAREMGGDGELAGALVIGTTSLSLLTYLGWLAVLGA